MIMTRLSLYLSHCKDVRSAYIRRPCCTKWCNLCILNVGLLVFVDITPHSGHLSAFRNWMCISHVYCPAQQLRSLLQSVLFSPLHSEVIEVAHKDRAFSVKAPCSWNALPLEDHPEPAWFSFWNQVKLFVFTHTFNSRSVFKILLQLGNY